MTKILCISDSHSLHKRIPKDFLPEADVIAHGGDCTNIGYLNELRDFLEWFSSLHQYTYKVFIAGNHDWCFQRNPKECAEILAEYPQVTYLQDQTIEIEGIKIYGSPHQPWFHNWAFNLQRGKEIREKWDLIPKDTEFLITHGPPYGIGDFVPYRGGEFVGCKDLEEVILTLPNLKAHLFGHIHCGYGHVIKNNIQYVNASVCNEAYNPVQKPILITI